MGVGLGRGNSRTATVLCEGSSAKGTPPSWHPCTIVLLPLCQGPVHVVKV